MNRDLSTALLGRVGACAEATRAALASVWRMIVGPAVYQPEAHYMRGPGPKCREKDLARRPQA